jgi:hypothetical protein
MPMLRHAFLPPAERLAWRLAQWTLLGAGFALIAALLLWPRIALVAIWDVLIPVAPALFVFAPGLWRNICPLGMTSQLPRRFGVSRARQLSPAAHGWLSIAALALLLVLVPSRHIGLDDTGAATAAALVSLGALALLCGFLFAGKSAWCSGLCPISPVEQLYGSRPALAMKNAHCPECIRCIHVCPDSTYAYSPTLRRPTRLHTVAGLTLVGAFPGFVLGWYQVPPAGAGAGLSFSRLIEAFGWPWGLMAISLGLFLGLRALVGWRWKQTLGRTFAAAAVSIYYWYKLPSLLGLDGTAAPLIDLGPHAADWWLWACRIMTTALFALWMIPRTPDGGRRPWLYRPPFAQPPLAVSIGRSAP